MGRGGRLGRVGRLGAVVVLLLVALASLAACDTGSSPGSSPARTIRPTVAGDSPGPHSPIIGIVTAVDPAAQASAAATPPGSTKPGKSVPPTANPTFSAVRGFTLLTPAGDTLTFAIGELDNIDEFPPDSLYDRLTSQDPVLVFFTVQGEKLIVYHIEDAG